MLRTKKKQLNLKPNRVLDKRSSRGMLYENEELRLRTIHINDEVEKGQTDIKKLRKENEYLKREIWSLRDECEKLEDVIKKVYSGEAPAPGDLPKYQPRVRKMSTFSGKWDGSGGRRGSGVSYSNYSYYDENESEDRDDPGNNNEDDEDFQSYEDPGPLQSSTPTLTPKNPLLKQDSQDLPDEYFQNSEKDDECENADDSAVENMENLQKIGYFPSPPLHQTWQMHAPELEAVTEESETSNNASVILADANSMEMDHLNNLSDIRFIDSRSTSVNSEIPPADPDNGYTLTPFFNPTIEITPASSPTPTRNHHSSIINNTSTTKRPEESRENSPHPSKNYTPDVQDLGCVTLIPKKYQVTSELKILSDRILPAGSSTTNTSSPSPSTSANVYENEMTEEKNKTEGKQIDRLTSSFLSVAPSDDNPSSSSVSPCASPDIQTLVIETGHLVRPIPSQYPSASRDSGYRTLSFYSDTLGKASSGSSIISNNKLVPLYQSEPSLNCLQFAEGSDKTWCLDQLHGVDYPHNNSDHPQIAVPVGFNGFDQSVEMCGRGNNDMTTPNDFLHAIHGWNSVDKNLVIGYLDENSRGASTNNNNSSSISSSAVMSDLTAQEIIDELEVQFDPTLEKIAGVRMLTLAGFHPRRLFISLRTAVGVKLLLEKGFTLRGQKVRLVDASQTATGSFVILSGLPASFPDSAVISVLNQFGQVVAPLERRIYKGVDISERLARMHLFRNLPGPALTIAGYEVLAKVVSHGYLMEHPEGTFTQHSALSSQNVLHESKTETPSKPLRSAAGFVNFRPAPNLRPVSTPNASAMPSTTPNATTGIPRPHKLITRSVTLENPPGSISPAHFSLGPTAAAINKRKMSICSAVMETSAAIPPPSPGPPTKPALLGNPKKPLSRLPRSSPGSLTPASPVHQPGETLIAIDSTGAKPLLRSMSFEPRRVSSFSKAPTEGSQLSLPDSQIQCQSGHGGTIGGRHRFFQQHGQLSGGSNSSHFRSLDKKESLPWCGCWGNGCI